MTEYRLRRGRGRGGRPSRDEALERREELLDRALDLFLDKGFEAASIDAIAASVGMSKRTVYSHYSDKTALFLAVVQRAVGRWVVPVETLRAAETEDLEDTLTAFAELWISRLASPGGSKLQRLIAAEVDRFPEIALVANQDCKEPGFELLADLVRRHTAAGTAITDDPDKAAAVFLSMVVGGQVLWGGETDANTPRERARYCASVFVNGIRPR